MIRFREGHIHLGDARGEVLAVVGQESIGSGKDRCGQMHRIDRLQTVGRAQYHRQLDGGVVDRTQVEPRQNRCQRPQLVLRLLAGGLGQKLRDEEQRTDCGDRRIRDRGRLGKKRTYPPSDRMTPYRRVDQDVGIECVHLPTSATGAAGTHLGDEGLSARLVESIRVVK